MLCCPYFLFWHFLANSAPASSWPEVWGWCSVSGWFVNRGNTEHKMWTSHHQNMNICPLDSRSCNWMDAIVAVIIVNSKTQNKYNNFTTRGDVCALIRLPPILDYLDLVSLFIKLRCIEALVPGASWRHSVYLWRAAAPAPGREQTSSCCHFILAPHHRSSRYVDR